MSRRSIRVLPKQKGLVAGSDHAIENGNGDIAPVEVKGYLRRNSPLLLYRQVRKYVEKEEAGKNWPIRRPQVFLISSGLLLIGLILGGRYYLYDRTHEWTDDAFIRGDVTQIMPQVAGQILKLHIRDNQEVKQGDLLIEIDSRDYEARLAESQAALQSAEANHRAAQATTEQTQTTTQGSVEEASSGVTAALAALQTARAQAGASHDRERQAQATIKAAQAAALQAQAQITEAEAEATRATADVRRYQTLHREGVVSQQQLDQSTAAAKKANAQLAAARERAAAAAAQVEVTRAAAATAAAEVIQAAAQARQAQAQLSQARARSAGASAGSQQVKVSQEQASSASSSVEQARNRVSQAQLQLSHTRIYAPVTGRITNRTVADGNYVQVGQALMAIVTGSVWVEANFKETQITHMQPGQPVAITVDAYPGRTFRGKVDSIQLGSDAAFSLFPSENAAGNFVKIPQRVPVRIVFVEAPDPKCPMGPGWSVIPEVQVR